MVHTHFKTTATILLLTATLLCQMAAAQNAVVDDIRFTGNNEISASKLRSAIKTRENPWIHFFLFWKDPVVLSEKVLLNDLLRIEQVYHEEGYLNARVTDYRFDYSENSDAVRIEIQIEEGEPALVDSVRFACMMTDSLPFTHEKLQTQITLKPERRYRRAGMMTDYHKLTGLFTNAGYPYIEARLRPDIRGQTNRISLTWQLNPGPFCRFGPIEIKGNQSVSEAVILRGIDFRERDRFEQKKLAAAQSQIYQLEMFQYVNLQAVQLDERITDIPVQVQVKERNLHTLNLGAGYGTEEGFRIKLNWTNRNFLGGARILRTYIKHATRILPLDADIEMSQPFFFDDQNDLIFRSFYKWQDEESFEVRRLGFETIFSRQLSGVNNFFISARIERDSVRVKDRDAMQNLDDLYNKSVLTAGFNRNSTNQLFTPSDGIIVKLRAEESGALLESRFQYYKFSADIRHYEDIGNDQVLALRLFSGLMKPYGNSDITPIEERFFAGGAYSVRGWERQTLGPQAIDEASGRRTPVGGNSRLEGNIEWRYPVYKNFGGAVFLDFGEVWKKWDGVNLSELMYAAGMGLNYHTPIGPVRFDMAWKLNKQVPRESDYEIHFSIGQAF